MKYDFIQVFSSDNIKLSALVTEGNTSKTACIFVHGFETDFYSHDFYHAIARELSTQGNLCILAQLRGTGLYTEFIKKDGSGTYIGSFHEKIEDAHLDISAFVEYLLSKGFQKISLIGHSLGTIKAVRYLFEGKYKDKIGSLVLLSPFDKNAWIQRKSQDKWKEYLKIAEQKVAEGKGAETVPLPEYEDYPLTYETFVSWYRQNDLGCMWDFYRKDYDFPILRQINVPVKTILGSKDDFMDFPEFGVSPQSALARIKELVKNSETVLLEGSDHVYRGFEDQLATEVASFVN
jgi:pimeloyl-ACP methyl ester carboxylesterase